MTDPAHLAEVENGALPLIFRVALRFGVSAVIAGFLVYFLANQVSGDVKQTHEEVRAVHDEIRAHSSEQRFYLRAICLNGAKDDAARAQCIPTHGE